MTVTLSSLSPLSGSPASIKREIILPSIETMQPPTMINLASSGATGVATGKPANKAKSRKRVNTAEKRHQHNAIERQRRETLNGKFLSLARLLPALANSRRPSKSAIVNSSIAHLTYQRDQRLLAAKLLRRLASQHDALLAEVNEWRKNSGYAPKESAAPWTDEMEEVCGVEKEVFGNFAGFDDGDGEDNDNDNEDAEDIPASIAADPALEAANNIAANFSHGLITPRHSTELDAISHAQALFGSTASTATPAGLMSSTLHSHADSRRAATVNGFNWSHDFGFSPSTSSMSSALGASIASASSSSASLPFSAFMSDTNLDVSSSGSPANSTQGGHVLTPLGDQLLYDHTSSPGSSSVAAHSTADGERATGSAAWTDNFLMMQQIQQAQLRHQQQQQQAALAAAAAQVHAYTASGNVAAATSMFNSMFPPGQSPPPLPSLQQQQQQQMQMQQQQQQQQPQRASSSSSPDAFTQNLLAGVFPQQGVSGDQIEAWRKAALALSLSQQQQQSQAQPSQPAGLRNIGRSHTVQDLSPSGMWDPRV